MKRHFLAGKTFFLDRVKIKRNKRIKRPQRLKIFVVATGGWWLEKLRETSRTKNAYFGCLMVRVNP